MWHSTAQNRVATGGSHPVLRSLMRNSGFYLVRVRGGVIPLRDILSLRVFGRGLAQSARVLGTPSSPSPPSLLWWVEAGDRVGEAVQIVIVQP